MQLKQSRLKPPRSVPRRGPGHLIESMEPRLMLSAATPSAHLFLIEEAGPFASPMAAPLIGKNAPFTPTDIRNYYGVNAINFGAVAGTGAGETIAIVDAYSQPNLLATG